MSRVAVEQDALTVGRRAAWHALPPDQVATLLGMGARGLAPAEATARLARFGPNRLQDAPPPDTLAILLHQFQSPQVVILLLAAVVTVVTGEYLDAAVISTVLALNAAIGFVQERQAERSVHALMRLVAPRARACGRATSRRSRAATSSPATWSSSSRRRACPPISASPRRRRY